METRSCKIWLDDLRPAPSDFIWVKSVNEAICMVEWMEAEYEPDAAQRISDKVSFSQETERLKSEIDRADAVLVGAGAGLSTSAGFVYSGERFQKYFKDYIDKYGFRDMYSGGQFV